MRMDAERFDALAIRLQHTAARRGVLMSLLAGTMALTGRPITAAARKRRKRKRQRCGRLQAACRSDKDCCRGKTGRVCASNDKDVQCRGGGTVCCLPVQAFGCNDLCDCCGGNTGCDAGQCKVIF
jgi:hypothetical protein